MRHSFFIRKHTLPLMLAIFALTMSAAFTLPAPSSSQASAGGDYLNVVTTASGTAYLDWNFENGDTPSHMIIQIDVISGKTIVYQSTTTANSAVVTGLTSGCLYSFRVSNGSTNIIVEDWLP